MCDPTLVPEPLWLLVGVRLPVPVEDADEVMLEVDVAVADEADGVGLAEDVVVALPVRPAVLLTAAEIVAFLDSAADPLETGDSVAKPLPVEVALELPVAEKELLLLLVSEPDVVPRAVAEAEVLDVREPEPDLRDEDEAEAEAVSVAEADRHTVSELLEQLSATPWGQIVQSVHAGAPVMSLYVPAVQAVHEVAPSGSKLHWPRPQPSQMLDEVAPMATLKVPPAHAVHAGKPAESAYVPLSQAVQTEAPVGTAA